LAAILNAKLLPAAITHVDRITVQSLQSALGYNVMYILALIAAFNIAASL